MYIQHTHEVTISVLLFVAESQEDCIVQLNQQLELLDIAKQHNEPTTQGITFISLLTDCYW